MKIENIGFSVICLLAVCNVVFAQQGQHSVVSDDSENGYIFVAQGRVATNLRIVNKVFGGDFRFRIIAPNGDEVFTYWFSESGEEMYAPKKLENMRLEGNREGWYLLSLDEGALLNIYYSLEGGNQFERSLVGNWGGADQGREYIFQFHQDGTLIFNDSKMTYKASGGDLIIETEEYYSHYEYKISGDSLILIDDQSGKVLELRKSSDDFTNEKLTETERKRYKISAEIDSLDAFYHRPGVFTVPENNVALNFTCSDLRPGRFSGNHGIYGFDIVSNSGSMLYSRQISTRNGYVSETPFELDELRLYPGRYQLNVSGGKGASAVVSYELQVEGEDDGSDNQAIMEGQWELSDDGLLVFGNSVWQADGIDWISKNTRSGRSGFRPPWKYIPNAILTIHFIFEGKVDFKAVKGGSVSLEPKGNLVAPTINKTIDASGNVYFMRNEVSSLPAGEYNLRVYKGSTDVSAHLRKSLWLKKDKMFKLPFSCQTYAVLNLVTYEKRWNIPIDSDTP